MKFKKGDSVVISDNKEKAILSMRKYSTNPKLIAELAKGKAFVVAVVGVDDVLINGYKDNSGWVPKNAIQKISELHQIKSASIKL